MKKTTISLAHGAMTAALTVLLVLLDRLTVGFLMPFLPIPLILYGMFYSLAETATAYIVTVLLVAIIPGSFPITIMMCSYGAIALIYTSISKKDVSKFVRIFIVFLGVALHYFIMIHFFGAFFGLKFETTMLEVEKFFRINNEIMVKIVALLIVLATIIMETFIIFLSTELVETKLRVHRK